MMSESRSGSVGGRRGSRGSASGNSLLRQMDNMGVRDKRPDSRASDSSGYASNSSTYSFLGEKNKARNRFFTPKQISAPEMEEQK